MTKKLFQMTIVDRSDEGDEDVLIMKFDEPIELLNKCMMYGLVRGISISSRLYHESDDGAIFQRTLWSLEDNGYQASLCILANGKPNYVGMTDTGDRKSLTYMRWEEIKKEALELNK